MFDCVLQWLEKGSCFVDICAVDFRKAFDLAGHLIAGMYLQEMGTKRRILNLVLDFLTGRKQKVFALHKKLFGFIMVKDVLRGPIRHKIRWNYFPGCN